jgi:pimeloyl-ACP methyl ester carboxylesterase
MSLDSWPQAKKVDAGEIRMAVHELGEGPPVLLIHGFPELAFSWRHQLTALADAGYRAIAPDMRGYGGSDKPPAVTDYTLDRLIGDVTGLMDALGLDKAVVVGHDWGALVAWQMALTRPERMAGLIALNIPFFKRPPIDPILYMRLKFGRSLYIVNFQDSDEADRRFAEDPARFIDVMMRRRRRDAGDRPKKRRQGISLLKLLDKAEPDGEPLLSRDELEVYAEAFAAGGFTGPINWYRNFSHNWKAARRIGQVVRVPTLFVGAANDVVVSPRQIEAMKPSVIDLEIHMIEDCGHWTQQEKPGELNAVMIEWLERRYPVSAR